jgi:hypothetical protein
MFVPLSLLHTLLLIPQVPPPQSAPATSGSGPDPAAGCLSLTATAGAAQQMLGACIPAPWTDVRPLASTLAGLVRLVDSLPLAEGHVLAQCCLAACKHTGGTAWLFAGGFPVASLARKVLEAHKRDSDGCESRAVRLWRLWQQVCSVLPCPWACLDSAGPARSCQQHAAPR